MAVDKSFLTGSSITHVLKQLSEKERKYYSTTKEKRKKIKSKTKECDEYSVALASAMAFGI